MQHRPWIKRIGVATTVVIVFFIASDALGEEPTKTAPVVVGDTFPASLGYAALGVAATVWGTMATVVGKLYYGREQDKKDAQAQIDALKKEAQAQVDAIKKDAQTQIDALRVECKAEITRMRDRLELEQKERREEAEKLLREQKDIMKEVMTTCSAISDALRKNTETLERMTQSWGEASE